jgi:N6-L-threonylcarbamoyladenine synthase
MTKILGIETSCDDTSICIIEETSGFPKILALKSFTQEEILKTWGGVVPEIAARNHLQKITPLLDSAFKEAKIEPQDIDAIGVTTLPGLLGPLLTGLNAAKTLSLIYQKPIIAINHLYAHLEAIHLTQSVSYPYLGLLISGGHTAFMWAENSMSFKILGSTIDDAAGEAFDKGGKLMHLGYPAGKLIDDLAKNGDKKAFDFPIGLRSSADARFSFSGLKTSLRVQIEKDPSLIDRPNPDLCASYQDAIVRALLLKTRYAIKKVQEEFAIQDFPIVLGGGVACNSGIREAFSLKYKTCLFVEPKFCTDNGAMIANYALRTMNSKIDFPKSLELDSRGRFLDKKDFKNG